MTSPEAVANNRLVPEEGVLYASLLVVSRSVPILSRSKSETKSAICLTGSGPQIGRFCPFASCGFSKSIRYGIIEFFVPAFD
jgi:hypothetical protein